MQQPTPTAEASRRGAHYLERQRIGNFCNAEGKLFTPRFRRSVGQPGKLRVARRHRATSEAARSDVGHQRLRFLGARGLPLMGFGIGAARTTTVTGLSALTTRLGGELRVLREAAFLVGNALAALAARDRRELPILRETALRARYALSALAAGFGGAPPVLRETAFLVRNRLAAHTCNLALPLLIHRRESTIGSASVLSWFVSHRYSPPHSEC